MKTPSVEQTAEGYGRDAYWHGVSIDGCRAFSERERIQKAWQRGWIAAQTQDRKARKARGEPPVFPFPFVR